MAMTKERLEEVKVVIGFYSKSPKPNSIMGVASELIAEVERLQEIEARALPLLKLDAQTKDLRDLSAKAISKISNKPGPEVAKQCRAIEAKAMKESHTRGRQ